MVSSGAKIPLSPTRLAFPWINRGRSHQRHGTDHRVYYAVPHPLPHSTEHELHHTVAQQPVWNTPPSPSALDICVIPHQRLGHTPPP